MKKVITYGTFDLFHEGHYKILERAKALGDYLIVGVTTEHFDEERGKLNLVDSIMERIENVKKTGFADMIIVEDHEGQKIEDIQKYGVDIFTVGSDWTGRFDYLKSFCQVVYLKRTPDISSTILREQNASIVRLGVVGTGRIAPRFIAESKFVSGVYVDGVYNPHIQSAESFEHMYDIKGYSGEFGDFLDNMDAIYIATPHEYHYTYAKQAILKGKHVLCEKPLVLTKADAEELFALAAEKHVILMEGIKTAYCPGFAQLINIVKSGRIGEITDVEACFSRLSDATVREMIDPEYGGAYLEFGSYSMLPIIKLLGTDFEDVQIDSILAPSGVDGYTKIHLRYKRALALAKAGVAAKSEGQLVIAGTKGYILAESPWWLTRKFEVRYEDPNQVERFTPKFLGDGLRYEISEFISKINGKALHDFKLTKEESIAMADIVERFMKARKKMQIEFHEQNRSAGMKIWAHRGCSNQYPENTLEAFKAACELDGLTGIEMDTQLTKDGEVVVFHDETLNRLMEAEGALRDFSFEELRKIKFKNAPNAYIPTLTEFLTLVKPYCESKGLLINIELKNGRVDYPGMEEKVLEMVSEFGLQKSVVYSSFNGNSILKVKSIDKSAKVGYLAYEMKDCERFVQNNDGMVEAYHPCIDTVSTPYVNPKHLPVRAWNSQEPFFKVKKAAPIFDLKELKGYGVTDIFTNYPEKYLEN